MIVGPGKVFQLLHHLLHASVTGKRSLLTSCIQIGLLQPERVAFSLRLGQSKPIFQAFKAIHDGPVWHTLTEAQQRIVEGTSGLVRLERFSKKL